MCVKERRGGGERKNVYMIKPLHYKKKQKHTLKRRLDTNLAVLLQRHPDRAVRNGAVFPPGLARSVQAIDHVHTHRDINTPAPAHSDASC